MKIELTHLIQQQVLAEQFASTLYWQLCELQLKAIARHDCRHFIGASSGSVRAVREAISSISEPVDRRHFISLVRNAFHRKRDVNGDPPTSRAYVAAVVNFRGK